MLHELRLYWKMRPFIKRLQEAFNMPFSINMVLTVLNIIGQAAVQLSGVVTSPKARAIALAVSMGIETILKIVAQFRNPDGTPAGQEWQGGLTKLKPTSPQ